jgi:hypothetical protein
MMRRELNRTSYILLIGGASLIVMLVSCGLYIRAIQPTQPGCPYLRTEFRDKCEFDRTFPAENLLVTTTLFDDRNIEVSALHDVTRNGAVERVQVGIMMISGDHIGNHEIARWTFQSVAEYNYLLAFSGYYDPNKEYWKIADIDYKSPIADRFQIVRTRDAQHVYRAVAQYQDHVSALELSLSDNFTEEDFVEILRKIDDQFAQYLELTP